MVCYLLSVLRSVSCISENSLIWTWVLLLEGAAGSRAWKANALRGGGTRLSVRAVKGAGVGRSSERSEDPLQKKRTNQAQGLARRAVKENLGLENAIIELNRETQCLESR